MASELCFGLPANFIPLGPLSVSERTGSESRGNQGFSISLKSQLLCQCVVAAVG